MVLRGLPGVGKSTLLADSVTRAEQGAPGVDGPSDEGGLRAVCGCCGRGHRVGVAVAVRRAAAAAAPGDAPRRRAAGAAGARRCAPRSGRPTRRDGDRFLVFLATLSLLAEAAEERPVLAWSTTRTGWTTPPPPRCFSWPAGSKAERVAMLFAARDGDVRALRRGELPELVLGGIDAAAAADAAAAPPARCAGRRGAGPAGRGDRRATRWPWSSSPTR